MSQSPMANQWIVDVKSGFQNHDLNSARRSEKVSIYKVPEFLVQLNQSAYLPQMVPLGPLHHDPVRFHEMESHKLHAARKTFNMCTAEEFEREVVGPIRSLDREVRESYQEKIKYEDWHLAWMLALDACFILETFRALGCKSALNGCFFHRNSIEYTAYPIIADMFMLENQIPLRVLLKILELRGKRDEPRANDEASENDAESPFTKLCDLLSGARIARLFYPFKSNETDPPLNEIPNAENSEHLLDLIRRYVIHSFKLQESTHQYNSETREIIIPSASELSRAGIKFTKMERNMMEISIKKNTFHLPRIRISSSVETLLRNLMAMEICEAKDKCVISRYVHLMCELIHSERDVSVLRKARIIKSYKGSDGEVADMFKTLSTGITRSYDDPFAKVREDAYNHYHSKIKVMLAEFTQEHFSSPWRIVSVIAACLLLFFTALQTLFSLHHLCRKKDACNYHMECMDMCCGIHSNGRKEKQLSLDFQISIVGNLVSLSVCWIAMYYEKIYICNYSSPNRIRLPNTWIMSYNTLSSPKYEQGFSK